MRKFLLLGVAAASIATVSNANALPLSYDIAVNGVSIGSGSDLTAGFLNFSASGSGFSVSGNASSAPLLNSPDFSSATFNIQSAGAALASTLTIRITDTSLTPYTGNVANQFTLNPLNGATFQSATISNYVDASNAAFGTATLLATTGVISTNPTGVTTSGITMAGLFSETTVYTLTFAAGGPSLVQASSSLNSVPEPMSLALLGSGLAAVGLIRRKRA